VLFVICDFFILIRSNMSLLSINLADILSSIYIFELNFLLKLSLKDMEIGNHLFSI